MISENKVVTLNYILRDGNSQGMVIESTYEGSAMEFIYGIDQMIPRFEERIAGLSDGDHFAFSIESKEAYGETNPQAIVDLDINLFRVHDRIDYDVIKVNNSVPMQDSHGNRLDGLVLEVSDTNVKMDFNHPLAGKDLFFEGEILSVREATAEEMSHGHVHGQGHHHGGGGCGCSTEGGHGHGHHHHEEEYEDSCGCGSGCGCN